MARSAAYPNVLLEGGEQNKDGKADGDRREHTRQGPMSGQQQVQRGPGAAPEGDDERRDDETREADVERGQAPIEEAAVHERRAVDAGHYAGPHPKPVAASAAAGCGPTITRKWRRTPSAIAWPQ